MPNRTLSARFLCSPPLPDEVRLIDIEVIALDYLAEVLMADCNRLRHGYPPVSRAKADGDIASNFIPRAYNMIITQ